MGEIEIHQHVKLFQDGSKSGNPRNFGINAIFTSRDDLPDERKPGNNRKYEVEDAVMAAFSVFFTQSPSFLDHQRLMKSNKGKDNAES